MLGRCSINLIVLVRQGPSGLEREQAPGPAKLSKRDTRCPANLTDNTAEAVNVASLEALGVGVY